MQTMQTLKERLENGDMRYYVAEEALHAFLDAKPAWRNARIVKTDLKGKEIDKAFWGDYIYEAFLLSYKGREYQMIFSEPQRGWKRCVVKTKRIYKEGEKKIKRTRKYSEYSYKRTQNYIKKDTATLKNSCQIYCMSILLDISYEEAHKMLAAEGWAKNNTYNVEARWSKALNKVNKGFFLHWKRWGKEKGYSLKNLFELVPKKGRFLIGIRGHVLSVIDGQVYDNVNSSPYCHITEVWKIE